MTATTLPAARSTTDSGIVTRVLATTPDTATALLRIVLGLVILPHGLQKTLGLFGGYGFSGTMGWFSQQLHVPVLFAFLAILAETAGALGLITGLLTRVAALGVFSVMAVATVMVHWQNGFFMNWTGAQAGEGFEYHLLAMVIAVALMVRGGGRWSLDGRLSGSR